MIEALKATARDVALASFATFAGALAVALQAEDFSLPYLKAAVIAAAYAAGRTAVGVVAAKLAARKV